MLVGVGQVARAVFAQTKGLRRIVGTTRDPRKIFQMADDGYVPLIMPLPSAQVLASEAENADVVISYPPDGQTDEILAPAVTCARRVIYISTTGVYGKREGIIDDTTPADDSTEGQTLRLAAEKLWQQVGAIVLRAPGIYGADSGLHKSLGQGRFRLADNGRRYSSRIHVEDLATIILSVFAAPTLKRRCYVVGDQLPCSQLEIVSWLCEQMNIPLPPAVPAADLHTSLRGNRRINPDGLLNELGITLKYPDYKQGYGSILRRPPS